MEKKIKLTILIPAYNEEKIIAAALTHILQFMSGKNYTWEILVIDDGSRDKTSQIVKNFEDRSVRLTGYTKNQGKGAALRTGVKNSKGEYIIFSDADLSVPVEFLDKCLTKLEEGNNIVIGSRRAKGAEIAVHQSWMRETMGRVFTFLAKIITGTDVSDFTCGFKGFKKKAALTIFGKSLFDRWAYDAEILYLAKKEGYKIVELPVLWQNREETRVVLVSAILTSFLDLFKIRLNDILGRYGK